MIKLSNGMVLYLREVNKYLALVCILREDNFDKHGMHMMIARVVGSGVLVIVIVLLMQLVMAVCLQV